MTVYQLLNNSWKRSTEESRITIDYINNSNKEHKMTDSTANFEDTTINKPINKTVNEATSKAHRNSDNDNDDNKNKEVTDSLQTFETRWRYAVFPAMVLFVLLIGFMFYLIYGMLQRMEDLSKDIHEMSKVITVSMPKLNKSVDKMTDNIGEMKVATTSMAITTHGMGQNLWDINSNISKPLSAMNKILPWSYMKNRSPRPVLPPNYYIVPKAGNTPVIKPANY